MPLTSIGNFSDPFNRVFIGDNLPALRALRDAQGECADLVYLDPPFNSNSTYAFIGGISKATATFQVAFRDMWDFSQAAADAALAELAAEESDAGERARRFLLGWKMAMGAGGQAGKELAYLCHMVPRLTVLRTIMKPTASIYLHCDPTASHALKKAMDAVFGPENFRNEIVWHHPKIGVAARQFTSNTDTLLFYSKGDNYVFTPQTGDEPNEIHARFARLVRGGKLHYRELKTVKDSISDSKCRQAEKRLGRPLRDGDVVIDFSRPENKKRVDNVWKIPFLKGNAKERVGYPTQKPLALLRRIIAASSNPGDVVLDPYCGCGTTVAACLGLQGDGQGRRFIGMDMEGFAAQVMKRRMHDQHGGYKLELGCPQPKSLADFDLMAQNKAWLYYEHYAVELIPGAMPATNETKELLGLPTEGGGDKGMDGLLPVTYQGRDKALVISVKAGDKIPAGAVRDLCGVMHNNTAVIGGVLVYRKGRPTSQMLREAERAGYFPAEDGGQYPKVRLLSVKELWEARAAVAKIRAPKERCGAWARRLELSPSIVAGLSADFNDRPPQQGKVNFDRPADGENGAPE